MAKTDYWATPPWAREQFVLIAKTLDESIRTNHPVRLVDVILRSMNWDSWEAKYPSLRGRPPIHPSKLVALLLYGLTRGLRSSRSLEDACDNQLDLMWLMEGLCPDHSTICAFRTEHGKELKELFGQVCHLAAEMGAVRLNQVAIDGSAIRASSGRYRTLTRDKVEKRLEELKQQFGQMLDEAQEADHREDQLLGNNPNQLPAELQDAQALKKKLQEALQILNELDEAKKKEGVKTKSQVPETDMDSRVLPNKEGGYAPNYTAMVATDGECGFIVNSSVIQGNVEAEQLIPILEQTEETFGRPVENALADSHFAQGYNLEQLENSTTAFYSPLESSEPQEGNPAYREDPTQPVPETQWDQLPYRSGKKPQLDKSAFVYVATEDTYYCPQGRRLPYVFQERVNRSGRTVTVRRYEAKDCSGCPLRDRCIQGNGKVRTIRRDQYSATRERHAQKMKTSEAQTQYSKRMGIVEASFGSLKGMWRIRQFLLRGLQKVDTEWRWICLAFNIKKLIHQPAAMRAWSAATQQ